MPAPADRPAEEAAARATAELRAQFLATERVRAAERERVYTGQCGC
jgi:hypothetical protein